MTTTRTFATLAAQLRAVVADVRLVGIDGCGGAGKSTFAARLAAAGGGWPVVHTDDFATHDEPLAWWPRMLQQVIEPLTRGESATFRPYDWVARAPADGALTVPPADVVLIEGVGATRSAWRDVLCLRIWVEAPRQVRLRRGIERDGEQLREFWQSWMAAEDSYVAEEHPSASADLVVDGAPERVHDDTEFVVVTERRRGAPSAPTRR